MSGPKYVSYTIDNEARQRARERAQHRGEALALADREARLRQAAEAARLRYGRAIEVPSKLAGLDLGAPASALRESLADRRRVLEAASQRLETQIEAARRASLLETLAGDEKSVRLATPPPTDGPRRRGASAPAEPPARSAESVRADVERIVARLAAEVTATVASGIEHAAQQLLAQPGADHVDNALDDLRARVQLANQHAEQAAARRAEVDAWRERLAGLDHPLAQRALGRLSEFEDGEGPLPPATQGLLEEAAETGERSLDDAYVGASVADALRGMGYAVSEGFETLLADRGFADISNPRWRGYGVRVRASGGGQGLQFNVVRGPAGDTQKRRDAEVEQEWCDDVPALLEELSRVGVTARITRRTPAGVLPVQVVEDLPSRVDEVAFDRRELTADS